MQPKKVIPLIKSRRLPPSSKLLHSWSVVATLVGIKGALRSWTWPPCTETISRGQIDYSNFLPRRDKYVDATGSEIGSYPLIEALLIDGIITSKRTDLLVVPQFKIPPPSGASVDFSITVVEEEEEEEEEAEVVSISSTVMPYMNVVHA